MKFFGFVAFDATATWIDVELIWVNNAPFEVSSDRMAKPLVSICIPTFNSERWITQCVESAVNQSYVTLEILIVDDASTDNTVRLINSFKDPRVRLVQNQLNVGMVTNWNRCIELARGEYIKFLFQDDILHPTCVEKMMQLFLSNRSIGFVFSAREIIIDGDTPDAWCQEWLNRCTTLHTQFSDLYTFNTGRDLFTQYCVSEFKGNWIGEPTSVMVRKTCFEQVGLFNPRLAQICDVEMWLRIIFFYDVGFLNEKLSSFRLHQYSASRRNTITGANRLDRLRLLHALLQCPKIKSAYPQIRLMRCKELLRVIIRSTVPLQIRRELRKL